MLSIHTQQPANGSSQNGHSVNGFSSRPLLQPATRPWLDHYPQGVPTSIKYPDRPLNWLLEAAATRFPRRPAYRYYNESATYDEVCNRVQKLTHVLLREGLQPGDRVGVLLPNLPESIVSLFAIWNAGGVVVSLSPLMVAEEVNALMKATNCRFVITLDILSPLVCAGDYHPEMVIVSSLQGRISRIEQVGYAWIRFQRLGFHRPCPATKVVTFKDALLSAPSFADYIGSPIDSVDRPAFILPTGGTTGHPKAVTLSHCNLMAQAWQLANWSQEPAGEHSMLAVLPFFHSYGLSTSLMMGTALGATLVLHHRFRPASVAKLIEKHRPTMFMAVPAMLSALNSKVLRVRPHDFSSLEYVISGGASLPQLVSDEFQEHSGAVIVEGYGLSEASPVTHVGPLDGTAITGSIGFPIPDTDAVIVDRDSGQKEVEQGEVGELLVRGPQVMLGYWNDPEQTSQVLRDGWLYTGDLATCDKNGFFRIVDRKKDLIITSGFNVYPGDVEETLREFPGVDDVAVIGVPDADRGELVKAIVVMQRGKPFNEHEFESFCKEKLSAHKRPRLIESRAELPRNFLGKVLRRELRDEAQQPEAVS